MDIFLYKYQLQFNTSIASCLVLFDLQYWSTGAWIHFGQVMFAGAQIRLVVSWLGGSWSRLPDMGAKEAQHSCLVAGTGVLELSGVHPSRF